MSNKIPEDYFNKLPDRISQRIDLLEDDIKTNAPILASIDKEQIYKVPEQYFEKLTAKISLALPQPRVLSLSTLRWASAAAVALMITIGSFYMSQMQGTSDALLAESEILDYYILNADQIDDEWLQESWLDNDQDQEMDLFGDLETEDISDYLSDVIMDIPLSELTEIDNI